ncbi:MAG: SusC/RagA family TonB-linked outer membrane protein [Bacteroidales bacterium]|nr:SusC/RagA family TonB-linked outer membrane protein [Bacteroidales bacterium]MCF8456404.1 SusC/RagA family TonB-linked outer membrane protein [Bacteroidales bacterium]
MAKNLRLLLFLGLFTFVAVSASAQTGTIKGKITDKNTGEPLIGASVIVQGTTIGASTNLDGGYELPGISTGSITLEASFIGFQKELKPITVTTDGATVNFELTEDSEMIEELVVIGYGTQKKTDKTGAVANVKAEELNGGVLTDPMQALQGKSAGVTITKPGGDPNGGFAVKIRGQSGFFSGTNPLYVVDGVPGVDPTTISPEDIASYNILKDAGSTAIYGARGANGVILIETKSGKYNSENKIELNLYNSFDYVANRLDMLSADDLRKYVADNNLNFLDGGANTDWQDAIYRRGMSQSYNLAASGGDDNSTYRASLTHSKHQGVILNSDKERTIARINLQQKGINDRLTLSTTLSGTIEKNNYVKYDGNGPQDVLYQAFSRNPTDPVYTEDGKDYYEIERDFQYNNPVSLAEEVQNDRAAKRLLANMKADFEVTKSLTASLNLGYTRNDDESFYFEPTTILSSKHEGYGKREYNNFESKVLEALLRYDKTFNEKHNINLIGGYSFQEDGKDGLKAQGKSPYSNFLQSDNLGSLLNVNPQDISSYKESNRLISFFGRAVYNYDTKYYLTATLRRDGSSRFGNNHKWGWFPSASVGWNISREAFLEDVDFIETLKLRVSYGLSGNQEIDNYRSQIYATPYSTGIDPETGQDAILFDVRHNANPNLKWEENSELNIGIDFGILNNRISGSLEVYDKRTYDLVAPFAVDVPPNIFPTTWANAGEISNKGVELNLQLIVMDKKRFDWKSTIAFSKNIQKIESLKSTDGTFEWSDADRKRGWLQGRGLVGNENWTTLLQENEGVGTFYMPEFAGISDDGVFLFHTAAGGVTRNLDDAERRVVGSAEPDFELGWSNYFTFFNFDINLSMRAVIGGMIMNNTRMIFSNPKVLPTYNALSEVMDEIDKGLNTQPTISSYYLEDASYLKIDNLSIGYTFDVDKLNWLSKFRIYVVSNNLYTFTKYSGLDPEISYDGLDFGVDKFNVYPKTRTFAFGINATF